MNKKGRLIVYSGPSGVGKGTVIKEAMKKEPSLVMSISATTRSPREGEEDGVNYFFITKEQFEKKIEANEMLEYAQYNGNFYGTPKDFVRQKLEEGKNVVLEIEVQGALQIREKMPEALLIFLMPPSFEELKERLVGRHTETKEQIKGRLCAAKREMKEAVKYDFIVINDKVEKASLDIIACVRAASFLERFNHDFINQQNDDNNKQEEILL